MANQPEDFVPCVLQHIQATLAEQTRVLADHTQRFDRIEKHLVDLSKLLRYSMGRNEETAFRQSQQESRIDELFRQLERQAADMTDKRTDMRYSEKIPSDRRPSRLDLLIEQFEKMSPEERRRTIEDANEVLRAESAKALEDKTD